MYDGLGTYIDGFNKYEGRWLAGKKSGHGIMTFNAGLKNEISFAGIFKKDKLENGATRTDHQTISIGDIVNYIRSGKGKLEHLFDGSVYTGEFLNDIYHGRGKLVTKEYTYSGSFFEG